MNTNNKQKETFSPNYQWGNNLRDNEANLSFSLYPSESCAEDIELVQQYMKRATSKGYVIEREHKGRDHYHYWIPRYSIFVNADYA